MVKHGYLLPQNCIGYSYYYANSRKVVWRVEDTGCYCSVEKLLQLQLRLGQGKYRGVLTPPNGLPRSARRNRGKVGGGEGSVRWSRDACMVSGDWWVVRIVCVDRKMRCEWWGMLGEWWVWCVFVERCMLCGKYSVCWSRDEWWLVKHA